MSSYTNLASTACTMLTNKGQVVTFSRQTGGTFDPILGSESGASPTTFTANAIPVNYSLSEIDGVVVIVCPTPPPVT